MRILSGTLSLAILIGTIPFGAAADGVDAYGRNTTRVEGGTYYAEKLGDSVYQTHIREYACPANNGGPHHVESIATAPTCVEDGINGDICTLCGETEVLESQPAKGHDYQSAVTLEPTTEQEGIKTFTCRNCGDTYTESIPRLTEATPNTMSPSNGDAENNADAGNGDMGERSTKRVVGGTYFAEQEGNGVYIHHIHNYTCPKNNGGKHQLQYHKQNPTCEAADYNYYRCTLCGETELIKEYPALGHDYVSKITSPATATTDGVMTFTCTRCGDSYTETIPKFGGSASQDNGTEESKVKKDPNAEAAVTNNRGSSDYSGYHANTVKSYLYNRADGGYMRVEALNQAIAVEVYDQSFQLLTAKTVPMELSIFGGFYAADGYNYLIFGQNNTQESDQQEVIRVVQYSKNWERLGQASLKGANTVIPFDAGSLRCTEYNGYLYIQTCHEMYTSSDGLNHQANLTFSVRQSDMTITDSQYSVSNISTGYVSHSFNQFIMVDQEGRLVTLNHGDAIPRGAVLVRYNKPAGSDRFLGGIADQTIVQTFSESNKHYNYTGALLGGLSESSSNYLSAYSIVPSGGKIEDHDVKNVVLAVTDKERFSGTSTHQLTNYTDGGNQSASTPALLKLSNDRFLVVWNILERDQYGVYRLSNQIGYAFVDGDGSLNGSIQTAQGALSDCQPIYDGTAAVWYYTNHSVPVFCSINASTGAFQSYGTGSNGDQAIQQPDDSSSALPSGSTESKPDDKVEIQQNDKEENKTNNETVAQPDGGSTMQPNQEIRFTDVPRLHWGYDYIIKAAQAGLMIGVKENKFAPEGNLTTAQVLTLAYRLHSAFSGKQLPEAHDDEAWYMPYYRYCVQNGIIHEEEMPISKLNQYISRYEMVGILDKAVSDEQMQPVKTVSNGAIPDVEENQDYGAAVYRWYRAGVLVGSDDGKFHGESNLTRAETAAILCRLNDLA